VTRRGDLLPYPNNSVEGSRSLACLGLSGHISPSYRRDGVSAYAYLAGNGHRNLASIVGGIVTHPSRTPHPGRRTAHSDHAVPRCRARRRPRRVGIPPSATTPHHTTTPRPCHHHRSAHLRSTPGALTTGFRRTQQCEPPPASSQLLAGTISSAPGAGPVGTTTTAPGLNQFQYTGAASCSLSTVVPFRVTGPASPSPAALVAMASTADCHGYLLAGADGGVFAFSDAAVPY
jgi:hypothetical protein